ncbi:hypothetical protein GG804_13990 [Sphingomonas histidinilytica]|uniref:hypothetical protein n=1 Tax=Rhizorhabdus histidinilytica TaxID=439228 RepID=UPI001ADAF8E1|nr:hypothetical protein [Rhizorhabdus histidinilytica]MBO9377880.1 hypothetical protein [Rhizorhabdus histidinilytica]
MFLYNPNGPLTVMHLADYNRLGVVVGALCGKGEFSRSCNLPLGQPVCTACSQAAAEIERLAMPPAATGRMLGMLVGMVSDGYLFEGQLAKASSLDRVEIRRLIDDYRQFVALQSAAEGATRQ